MKIPPRTSWLRPRPRVAAFVAASAALAPLAARAQEPALAPAAPVPASPVPATTPATTLAAPPATPPPATPPALPPGPPWPVPPASAAGYHDPLAQEPPSDDHALVDTSPRAHDGHPLAGYHNGLFFLRDHHDDFHLYIQGRAQLDFYGHLGPGVSDTALHPTLFVRRIRPELAGELLGRWRFMMAGDFGATGLDNPRGTNEVTAAAPGAAPTATSARFAAADATRFQAAATDVFINYREASIFNVQVGQFDAPFTMENRTSDKFFPFMERSLAVRAIGVPTNKELGGMLWGETKDRFFYYSVGPFMGDGQNRPNVDSRFDVFGRTFVHPLATAGLAKDDPLRDLQVGVSLHYGSRDREWVDYDYPAMTTQGAFQFWSPSYGGAAGNTHIIPSGAQRAAAGELRVPIDRFDVTGEVVYIDNETREAVEGFQATSTERQGKMTGVAYYAMVGFWPFGKRDVNGVPGYGSPPRLDWSKSDPVVPAQALQLLAKWEQVSLAYDGASRAGVADARNVDGDIKVNALSLGVNYWATRHVRLSLNYVYDMFPGSAPARPTRPGGPSQTSDQRAVSPGNTLATGVNDDARDNAHGLHEVLARFAVAL